MFASQQLLIPSLKPKAMKTIFILLICTLFVACEKPQDYFCVCIITQQSPLGGNPSTHEENYVIHNKKRKAVRECDNHEPSGIQVWTKTDCAVK